MEAFHAQLASSAVIFGVLAALASSIAYRCHFFRLPPSSQDGPLIRRPLMGAMLALILLFSSGQAALFLWTWLFPLVGRHLSSFPLFTVALTHIFTLATLTIFFTLFALFQPKGVVRQVVLGPSRLTSSWSFGMVSWLVSFPTTACVYAATTLLTYLFFPTVDIAQAAVVFLMQLKAFPRLLIVMIGAIIIAAPIFEEAIFRALLYNGFKRKMPFKYALLLSSFLFALLHMNPRQGWGNVPLVCALFVFSLYLGLVYEKKRSLLAPIALHMTFNSVNVMRILLTSS